MKLNTSTRVFVVAALTVLAFELARWIGGAYDMLPRDKLIGVALLALVNAVLNGFQSSSALHTEPRPSPSHENTPKS